MQLSTIPALLTADREIVLETALGVWLLRRDSTDATLYHVIDVAPKFVKSLDRFVGQALVMGANPNNWRGYHMHAVQRELNSWGKP